MLSLLRNKFDALGPVLKAVSVLLSGSAVSQLIFILVTPILTRLYNPEDFGAFALFMSAAGILSAAFCFRFEIAIFSSKSPVYSRNIVRAGIVLATISLVGYLILFAMLNRVGMMPSPFRHFWLYVPIAAFLLALFLLFSNQLSLEKRYSRISLAKVARATGISGLQLGFSLILPLGLVLGDLLGRLLALPVLMKKAWLRQGWQLRRLYLTIKRCKRFFIYSTPSALLNVGVTQSPAIFLGFMFSPEAAGMYLVAQRLVAAPVTMLGQALSQALSSSIARHWASEPTLCLSLFKRGVKSLVVIGGAALGGLALVAPSGAAFFLGSEWQDAGWYISALCWLYLGQLVSTSFINVLSIAEKQNKLLIWDLIRAVVVICCFVCVYWMELDALTAVVIYAFGMFCCYILLFFMLHSLIKDHCLDNKCSG